MAELLLLSNISSVFEIPEDELWPPKSSSSPKQACLYNVSFYVYENLPWNLTTFYENMTRHNIENVGENIQTEWILLQLFSTSPCRIYNAEMADYFLVPYMHITHCFLAEGYFQFCNQVPDSEMDDLFKSLQYYNSATKDRHIFIKMHDEHSTKRQMRFPPLQLTTGPRTRNSPTSIPLPLFHPHLRYQPSVLLDFNMSWWTRPRKYSFSAFYGGLNPRMRPKWKQPRRFRLYFDKDVRESYPPTIAGLPYFFKMMGPETKDIDIFEAYRDSVLCPILPGDNCWQRRFFDVIRSGCLPVVLEWPIQRGDNRSWHTAQTQGCPVIDTYPFAKGQFGNKNPDLEIDYDSFVVRAPGNLEDESNITSILKAMQDVLAVPEEVARRQENMVSYLPLFTYGVGEDAHRYKDGFSRVMEILRAKIS